jgi:isopenicillin N synthase-like dioxygenase
VENVLADSRKFFELPKETKMKYRKSDPLENFNGYTPPEDEK